MLLEGFTECFQISHTTAIKASSDLRNVSTMTKVNMSRTIHNMDPTYSLTDELTPLQTSRSIWSRNIRLWVSKSVTADGRPQHHHEMFWTPATTQDCVCLLTNTRQHCGSRTYLISFFSLDFTLCLIYVCLDQHIVLETVCKKNEKIY